MRVSTLRLRIASPHDAESILNINLRSIYGLCSAAYNLSALQRWVGNRTAESFRKNIDRGQIFIAESDGEAVGFFDVVLGEVLAVYVLPGWERKGIGSFLLSVAVEKARVADASVTVVASHNAVSFYEKHGFRSAGEITVTKNGEELEFTRMVLFPQGAGKEDRNVSLK